MASYTTDGNAQIAVPLPNGAVVPVSVADLAARGASGYSKTADGTYVVPGDATFRTLDGNNVPAAQYGNATPVAEHPVSTQPVQPGKDDTQTAAVDNSGQAAAADAFLRAYGLDGLGSYVEDIARGRLTWGELQVMLGDPTTAPGKVVDTIYPELRLARENKQSPVSIADVLNARQTTRQLVNQLGFGDAIPDTNALARDYITTGKSLVELKDRLTDIGDYAEAVFNTNPVSKAKLDELQQYYGVAPTRSDLIAFALNDNFTEATLHQRLAASAAGAAAQSTGFGTIDRTQAEALGSLGVTEAQARQGFGQLAGLQGATGGLTGQTVDQIGQQDQIDAAFSGNAFAQRRIARRQAEQQGLFSSGGGFARTKDGFGGVGTATIT